MCVRPSVRPSVPEGEPRCEAAHTTRTLTHGPAGREAAAAPPGMCVWDAAEGERCRGWRGGRLTPPGAAAPRREGRAGGGSGTGRRKAGRTRGGAGGGRGARSRCPASQPLPGPAAWAFPVLFPARERGEGKGNGGRRYVTGAPGGPRLPARGGRKGTRGQIPVRAPEAPRERARCARVRVTRPLPAPVRLSVCLSVRLYLCLSHGACAVDTTRVPQAELSASAEGSLQGNGLQGEERGSPGAAVPSGTLPAL